MARNPKLERIVETMDEGKSFSLTADRYEELTGASLPKSDRYLETGSALARCAKEHGFSIQVEQQIVRVVQFTKSE